MLVGVIFSSAVLLLLAGFLWFVLLRHRSRSNQYIKEKQEMKNEFEKQLLQSKIDVQEQTFSILGQELHDNIGQLLSSTKMLLGATERKLPEVPKTMVIANETLSKAIQDIRALSKSLSKEWLDQFNFIENLQTELERIRNVDGIAVQFSSNTSFLPLSREAQLLLFRTVQEALVNSLKHAKANEIAITIDCYQDIIIRVVDNGIGISPEQDTSKGVGRLNMKSRINLLRGAIHWESEGGRGTCVCISVPVQTEYI